MIGLGRFHLVDDAVRGNLVYDYLHLHANLEGCRAHTYQMSQDPWASVKFSHPNYVGHMLGHAFWGERHKGVAEELALSWKINPLNFP